MRILGVRERCKHFMKHDPKVGLHRMSPVIMPDDGDRLASTGLADRYRRG